MGNHSKHFSHNCHKIRGRKITTNTFIYSFQELFAFSHELSALFTLFHSRIGNSGLIMSHLYTYRWAQPGYGLHWGSICATHVIIHLFAPLMGECWKKWARAGMFLACALLNGGQG